MMNHSSASLRRVLGDSSSSGGLVFDRFIPVRSGMDLDVSRYLLTNKVSTNVEASPYQRRLAEVALKNRTRILAFNSKPPQPPLTPAIQDNRLPEKCLSMSQEQPLTLSSMTRDVLLNLVDWGARNVLAIAILNFVYLWNVSSRSTDLFHIEDVGLVTGVSWSPDGRQLAVGLQSTGVQLWDVESSRLLRALPRTHGDSLVGSLAWQSGNNNILASGGTDTDIEISDMRSHHSHVGTFRGHEMEVCRVKWSDSGLKLASGGVDGLVHVWDVSMASSSNRRRPSTLRRSQWLHRFDHHKDAVIGLAWCPYKTDVLASGAGDRDKRITLWDTKTGTHLNSQDVGSSVTSLCWNVHEPELLSSHGFPNNELVLWKYPAIDKTAQLMAHAAPIQWTAMSPDGCTVATASATEELLLFWDIYRSDPQVFKKQSARRVTSGSELFSSMSYIR